PVHRQSRRTRLRALRAINAQLGITPDFQRAQNRREPHQRAVGAEIAAPEILHEHRRHHQNRNHHCSREPDKPEEIQHFHVIDQPRRALQKPPGPLPPTSKGRNIKTPRAARTKPRAPRRPPTAKSNIPPKTSPAPTATGIPKPFRPDTTTRKSSCE